MPKLKQFFLVIAILLTAEVGNGDNIFFNGWGHPGKIKWNGKLHSQIVYPPVVLQCSAPSKSEFDKLIKDYKKNGVEYLGCYYSATTSYIPSNIGGSYPEGAIPPTKIKYDWILRDKENNPVIWSNDKDRWFLDIGKSEVQRAIINRAFDQARAANTDGVFFDNLSYKFWAPNGQTLEQWSKKTLEFLKYAREYSNKYLMKVVINTSTEPQNWKDLEQYVDGISYEMAVHPNRLKNKELYERELASYEDLIKLRKSIFLCTGVLKKNDKPWDEDGRKVAITALMVKGAINPMWGGIFVDLPNYEPWPSGGWLFWSEQLGAPLGGRQWTDNAVERKFENGTIKVTTGENPKFEISFKIE